MQNTDQGGSCQYTDEDWYDNDSFSNLCGRFFAAVPGFFPLFQTLCRILLHFSGLIMIRLFIAGGRFLTLERSGLLSV